MAPRERDFRRDGEDRGDLNRDAALGPGDIAWLRRLIDEGEELVKLAERCEKLEELAKHADDIIGSAEDRKWRKGLHRRGKPILIWIGSILAALVAALTVFDRIKPPGTGGH